MDIVAGLAHLSAASADGAEAAREPRCLGVPWREAGVEASKMAWNTMGKPWES